MINSYFCEEKEKKSPRLLVRFFAALLCSFPLFFPLIGLSLSLGLQAVLATGVQFFCGWPFYLNAWKELKRFSLGKDTLIVLGISGAYLFSFYTIWAEPKRGIYFETSSLLITAMLLARLVEERFLRSAENDMKQLLSLQPKNARIRRGQEFIEIPIQHLFVNHQFFVFPGERIPADGEIIEGACAVDESMLNGETGATEKQKGSLIFAGTLNVHGNISAIAHKIAENTKLGQMIHLVEQARQTKISLQHLAERIFSYFAPSVFIIALLTWAGFWFFKKNPREGLINAIAILVAACPMAFMVSSLVIKMIYPKAAQRGIIINSAETIKKIQKIKRLIIDKVYLVTKGIFNVEKVELDERYYPIVNTLCQKSQHPAAKGILEFLKNKSTISLRMLAFRSEGDKGVSGYFDQRNYYSGSLSYLEEHGIRGEIFEQAYAHEGGMLVGVGTDKLALGYFVLSDQIQSGAKEAIHSLKKMGIKTILMTSDPPSVAERIAENLDIDFYDAFVLPEQKVECVENIRREQKVVAMIGDGQSDALALAAADVSFVINSGMESASVGLMHPHVKGVVQAIAFSKQAYKKMNQIILFAFAYNVIAIPLAAFGILSPIIAGAAMALSSISYASLFLSKRFLLDVVYNKCHS